MNMIGEFAKRIIGELAQVIDWSLSNWAVTMIILVMMITGPATAAGQPASSLITQYFSPLALLINECNRLLRTCPGRASVLDAQRFPTLVSPDGWFDHDCGLFARSQNAGEKKWLVKKP